MLRARTLRKRVANSIAAFSLVNRSRYNLFSTLLGLPNASDAEY